MKNFLIMVIIVLISSTINAFTLKNITKTLPKKLQGNWYVKNILANRGSPSLLNIKDLKFMTASKYKIVDLNGIDYNIKEVKLIKHNGEFRYFIFFDAKCIFFMIIDKTQVKGNSLLLVFYMPADDKKYADVLKFDFIIKKGK